MPKKILLADDSITIQKVVELTFSDGDFEVTAVNNGSRAIQKLSEMRPNIILSDIIMPEKNGYEVCEYVKSHPDFRNIPVILLTGTFEPFDPDRAEKAGCDAVVTKPFESQSLIHKVDELIAQSQPGAAAAAPAVEEEPSASPWLEEPSVEPETREQALPDFSQAESLFAEPATPAEPQQPSWERPEPTPFAPSGSDAESFRSEEPIAFAESTPAAPPAEASPWDEPADFTAGEGAFAPPSFETPSFAQEPEPAPAMDDSPFGENVPAEEFSSQTRAFPRMTFDDIPHPAETAFEAPPADEPAAVPQAEAPAAPSPSPWDEPAEEPAFGTTAFPKMNFDDFAQPAPEPPAPPAWDAPTEEPAFGTTAFPKVNFDDFAQPESPVVPEPAPAAPPAEPLAAQPWEEAPEANPWATDTDTSDFASRAGFATAAVSPLQEETPFEKPQSPEELFGAPSPEPEPEPLWEAPAASEAEVLFAPQGEFQPEELPQQATDEIEPLAEPQPVETAAQPWETSEPQEPEWASTAVPEDAPAVMTEEPEEVREEAHVAPPAAEPISWLETPPPPPPPAPAATLRASDLTEEQIDRIARRVVEMLSDQVVRNIAWEVVPDLAEMVVKERIRQLESEA